MDVQKVILKVLGLAMLAALAAPAFALGQAPNDDFADRETISSLPFTDTEPAIGDSTVEPADPPLICRLWDERPGPGGNTVWYTYTSSPFAVEYLNVSTQGSNYDTVLSIYEGESPSPATLVAGGCNDDALPSGGGFSRRSRIAGVRLKPGTTYSIEVAAKNAGIQAWTLSLNVASSPVHQVSKTADTADGVCDGDCSLREAIGAANAAPGAVIVPPGTYSFGLLGPDDANATGDLDIVSGMGIHGAGPGKTIIDAQTADRILHVDPGNTDDVSLAVTGVTLFRGHTGGSGGAVLVSGDRGFADLEDVSIETSFAGGNGGALASPGPGRLIRSTIEGNEASGAGGGLSLQNVFGIRFFEVRDSTINANDSMAPASGGGGIQTNTGNLAIVNSTIHGNSAVGSGGGILASNTGLLCDCVTWLVSATVSGNISDTNNDDVGAGGGLRLENRGHISLTNSVFADNVDDNAAGHHDCSLTGAFATVATSHSLVETTSGGCSLGGPGTITGVDPALGPLTDNSGPVETQGFDVPSPLLDAGKSVQVADVFGAPFPFDQRGAGFPRLIDGDADGILEVDIGAFEHVADLAPSCPPASGSTPEDQPLLVNLPCTDPEGRPITYSAVTALHGSVTGTGGSRTYTPDSNYNGPDTISYTASDGVTVPLSRTVAVTVNPVPDAPAAAADSRTTATGQRLVVPAPGVLANDADADGDAVTADLVTQPGNGSLQLATDGGFTYTPRAGFSGIDTFTYRAADATSFSSPATVTLTVTPNPLADTDPPETTIAKPKRSKRRSVTVELAADELGSSFECQLDEKPFSPCSSPARIRAKAGTHTLLVRAIDKAGNADATPAQTTFRVRKRPPR